MKQLDEKNEIINGEVPVKFRQSWWHWFPVWWTFPLLVPLALVALARLSLQLVVLHDRLILRQGLLSKNETEIQAKNIRTLAVKQSAWGRLVGIGTVKIATAGTGDFEIQVAGLKNPRGIVEMLGRKTGGES